MADRKFSCLYCRKEKLEILKCGSCKAVHYCSKYCQRKDWPVHKSSCKFKKDTGAGTAGASKLAGSDVNANPKTVKPGFAKAIKASSFTGSDVNANPKTVKPDFAKAIKAAKDLFPGLRAVTKFKGEIPIVKYSIQDIIRGIAIRGMYISSDNRRVFKTMVVVRIVHRIEELQLVCNIHAFDVEDEDEIAAPLYFEIRNSDPRPYFTWDELKAGKFICIMDPELLVFPEGTLGFRIFDPREIQLLNKLD